MDRLINIKVSGNHLTKDGNLAGVQGEGNVTFLRITFDAGWDGLAKHLTWWDACGENPVKVILGADKLENLAHDTRTYLCEIPREPLTEAGWCSFVIDGYIAEQRQRTVEDKLKVLPANSAEDAPYPSDPTPSQAEQLQRQIENLLGDMQAVAQRAEDAMSGADEVLEARAAIENMEITGETVPFDSTEPPVEKTIEDGAMKLLLNLRQGHPGVFVGDGAMPEGYSVQVIPTGEGLDVHDIINEALQEAKDSGEFDGKDAVYVGSGDMPEDCHVQVDPTGTGLSLEDMIREIVGNMTKGKIKEVTLLASAWEAHPTIARLWRQVVQIDGVTANSQVSLRLSDEQVAIFYDKSLAFTTGNENGIVTVSAIGQKPVNDYTIQVSITEMEVDV